MFWNNNKENGADVIQNRTGPRVKLVFSRAPCVPGQWKSAVFCAVSQMLTNFFFLDFHGQRSLFFYDFCSHEGIHWKNSVSRIEVINGNFFLI